MVGRASDVAQDITEIRNKSYQLSGLPQIHQSFPPGLSTLPTYLHSALHGHKEPICRWSLLKGSPPKADVHLQRGRTQFTSFDQCSLLFSVGSGDSRKGRSTWIFLLLLLKIVSLKKNKEKLSNSQTRGAWGDM